MGLGCKGVGARARVMVRAAMKVRVGTGGRVGW